MKAEGRAGAFARLFLEHRGPLENMMFRRTGCRAAASDLVQELFLRLWDRADTEPEVAAGYLFRSARNLAIDHHRAENARAALSARAVPAQLHAEPSPPDAVLAASDDLAAVDRALRSLPERSRRVFLLNRLDCRSYGEIARALNVSVSTVEKDVMRALAACRAGVAAALLALLGLGVWSGPPRGLENLTADQATAVGERRALTLADGSTLTLDADSAVDIDIKGDARRIILRRGRAFFEVVKDGRPFVVKAAGGEIRVLGTRFEVGRVGDGVAVAVAEGCVSVAAATGEPRILTPGRRWRFGTGTKAGAAEPVETDGVAAATWRDGRLSFRDAAVSEIVEEINRYHPARIVLVSAEAAARRLSGNFPADNPDAALAALRDVLGLRQTSLAGRLILLR